MNKENIEKEIKDLDTGLIKVLDNLIVKDILHTISGDKIKIIFNDIECIYSVEDDTLKICINKIFEVFTEVDALYNLNLDQKKFEFTYGFIKQKLDYIKEIIKNNLKG